MNKYALFTLVLVLSFFVAACGTIATPTPEVEEIEAPEVDAENGEEVAAVPTQTPLPPTQTPPPPTATPTVIPPTATTVPTEAPVADDQVAQLVGLFGVAERGQQLFNEQYETEIGFWSCAMCHNVDTPDASIGPSLYGIADRTGERVEGEVAERYIYNSILHPYDYFVEGYEGEDQQRMPPNYEELLVRDGNEQDVYDLIAYLLTLTAE